MGRDDGDAYMVANAAMEAIQAHMEDCREFRRNLKEGQKEAQQDRERMRDMISLRFKELYGFLWRIAFAIIGFLIVTLIGLLAFIGQHAVVWNPGH